MYLKRFITDFKFFISKAGISNYLICILVFSILLAWFESDILIEVNKQISNPNFNSFSNLDLYKIIFLILSKIILSYLIVFIIFKLAKKLSIFIIKKIIKSQIYDANGNLENTSNSEITTSLLLSIRNFINAIQAASYLVSSGIFLILLFLNLYKLSNEPIILFTLIPLVVYLTFLFFNSKLIKYFSAKVRLFTKNTIDDLNLIDNSREMLEASKEAYKAYINIFEDHQNQLRSNQRNAAFLNLLPTLTLESIFYIGSLSFILVRSNPSLSEFTDSINPLLSLLIISSPRLFSLFNRVNTYTGQIAVSWPHIIALLNASKTKFPLETNKQNKPYCTKNNVDNDVIVIIKHPFFGEINIKSHNITLIKGKSGSGKSTFIKNLIYSQNCLFVKKYYQALHNQGQLFCSMNSSNSFFEGSILENITMKAKNFDKIRLIKALEISGIDRIRSLKNQKLTYILEFLGKEPISSLSSGEKQRAAISRSLFFGGRVLLFDEATSNLPLKEHNKIIEDIINSKIFESFIICSHHPDKIFKKEFNKKLKIYDMP